MSRAILRSGLRHRCAQIGTCFSKTLVFSPQGCDSGLLAWLFPNLFIDILRCSAHVFVHWSNGFCLVPIAPLFFSQREHDSETCLLDLIFLKLHRAFGATDPMVRRTAGFPATKSGIETNLFLTISFCDALPAT